MQSAEQCAAGGEAEEAADSRQEQEQAGSESEEEKLGEWEGEQQHQDQQSSSSRRRSKQPTKIFTPFGVCPWGIQSSSLSLSLDSASYRCPSFMSCARVKTSQSNLKIINIILKTETAGAEGLHGA